MNFPHNILIVIATELLKEIKVSNTIEYNLSDQALGAVMMALQQSLMQQSDIVPVLKNFKFKLSDTGLMVMNPPILKFSDDEPEDDSE